MGAWWGGWRTAAIAVAAAVLGMAAGAAITLAIAGGSGGSGASADTTGAKAQQLLNAWVLVLKGTEPPDVQVDALPPAFPPAVLDLARTAADAELVGGFSVPNLAGPPLVEAVLWTAGRGDAAVPLVRDAAVKAGWRSSPAFLVGPLDGAASFVCPGADAGANPGFMVAGFEQDGRHVLVLQLLGRVIGANPCPASSTGS
jgi:hypothetical protein